MATPRDNRLRRAAVQIVAQLPENQEEALAILRYADQFVRDFLNKSAHEEKGEKITPFRRR